MRIPSSHALPIKLLNINKGPVPPCGFSDVFQGTFRGKEVCVKRLRVSSTGGTEKVKKGHSSPHRRTFAVSDDFNRWCIERP